MMKSNYKLSLSLSILLILSTALPGLSISTQSNSLTNNQMTQDQGRIIAGSRNRWRRTKAPAWRMFGARRGSCLTKTAEFVPLVPPDQIANSSGEVTYHDSLWDTTSAYPKVFFYLPEDNLTDAELTLQDAQQTTIYTASLKLPEKAGIVSVQLPQFSKDGRVLPPLQVDQPYRWMISIKCPSQNNEEKEIGGGINRVASETLEEALEQAELQDKPGIYQEVNDWYNTVSSLADLIVSEPNNPTWKQQWHDLLVDIGYEDLADVTVIESAAILEIKLPE